MAAKQLDWRFKYVPHGEMEPDDKGRWQVVGSVRLPIELMPKYSWIVERLHQDYIDVDIVHLNYSNELMRDHDGYRFEIIVYHIHDANNGLWRVFHSQDFEEAKRLAQEKLNHLVDCLTQPPQTPPKQTVFSCLKSAASILWENTRTLLF